MKFWEVLLHPDREEHLERAEVARAANVLQVGEFQLLQLAYYAWHGEEMPEGLCDTLFRAYMLDNQVPHWARHYARRILAADELGGVDDQNPAYHRYDDDYATEIPEGLRKFVVAAALIVGVVGGGLAFSFYVGAESRQILPPYFQDDELPDGRDKPLRGS
jgi:hypothetical protein